MRHVARASGLLLLFEDEQWADLTSRELLEEIVESLKSIPALILVSVRTEHDEDLSERQNLLQLRLKPLGMMDAARSEEHTSELQSLMRISYAVFCLKKKKN